MWRCSGWAGFRQRSADSTATTAPCSSSCRRRAEWCIGPAADAPHSIDVVDDSGRSLPRRLLGFWRAAQPRGTGRRGGGRPLRAVCGRAAAAGPAAPRPTVFHFHGPWAEENLAAGDTSRVRLTLRRALERRVLRRADAHVVLSSAFRRVLVERYRVRPWESTSGLQGSPWRCSRPGDRAGSRARLGIDAAAFVAVCARRLVPRMGIDILLDAWGRARRAVAGGLDAADRSATGRCARACSSARRARRWPAACACSAGSRTTELVDAYRAADVAVVPTLAVEGFGLVVLEAAACGTPSIVSDVGGLPEAAAALDPSLVVPAGDTAALARPSARRPRRGACRRGTRRGATPSASPGRGSPSATAPSIAACGAGEPERAPAGRLPRSRRPAVGRRDRAAAAARRTCSA